MNYKNVICCTVGLFLHLLALSAANLTDFKQFEVIAPDTVEQGLSFEVNYNLVANNYKDWNLEKNSYFHFVSNVYDDNIISILGQQYYDTNNKVYFIAYGTGSFQLPQMEVTVSGRKYVCSSKTIHVRPNSAYGKEYELAKEWFKNYSYDIDTCQMVVQKNNSHITILSDSRNCLSIAVARNAKKLNIHPVVYWSTESDILSGNDNAQFHFLSYYAELLERFANNVNASDFQVCSYKKRNNDVEPLLGDIVYGPEEPYNKYQPIVGNERLQVGGIPILLTQIFAYYKFPSEGVGNFVHSIDVLGKEYYFDDDYTKVKIDWEKDFCNDYRNCSDTIKVNKISKLASSISSPICSSYTRDGSRFYDSDIKMSLVNFWNYAPSVKTCRTTDSDTICGLIYRELDNMRIPIATYKSNYFVCDGYDNEYLHINMGLYGRGNGYYHIPFSSDLQTDYPIDKLIIGIEPDTKDHVNKVIKLKKANTLREVLSKEECMSLRELSISGPLGNDDVKLLRQMLGAPTDDFFEWSGKLRNLDLSQAKFKTEKKGYFLAYRLSGHAGSSWIQYTSNTGGTWTSNSRSYNYDRMSESDWKSFKAAKMDRRNGSIVKYENGICTLYCYVKAGVISESMFFSCDNLRQIQLPKKTKSIMANGFNGCSSLRSIKLPKKVKECQKYAFSNDIMLETIMLYENQLESFDFEYLLRSNRCNPSIDIVPIK